MRTTLTLDDDLALALKERAKQLDQPFKQVVNDALRRGLEPVPSTKPKRPFRVRPNHGGLAPGIDPNDPKALKNLLIQWDDEHLEEVLRRDGSSAE